MHHSSGLSAGGLATLSGCIFLVILAAAARMMGSGGEGEIRPLSHQRTVVVAAAPDLAPLLEVIAARYTEQHRDLRVRVDTLSDAAALGELVRGRVQLAVVASDVDSADSRWVAMPIARDGVTLLVHQSNSIAILSDADMLDLYTGRILNWKMVGGDDVAVNVIKRSAGRSETRAFLRYLKADNIVRRVELAQGTSERLIRDVANDPAAVGIVSVAAAQRALMRGVPVKLLRVREVEPTAENIRDSRFPVTIPVSVVTSAALTGLAGDFVRFVGTGSSGELFAARQYVTPVISAP